MYRRVLLKLSGESFASADIGYGIDPSTVQRVATELTEAHALGVAIACVVGGGNIFRGLSPAAAGMDRANADYMGMLATIMNGMALRDALENENVPTRLQTALRVDQVAEPYIRLRAVRHLEKGRIVILAGGTGNPFFTTDTTAALRAAELGADCLLKATRVDGVYDSDPELHADAKLLEHVTYLDVINRDLKVMDATAITMCRDHELPIVVFNLAKPGNILKAVSGERIGTLVGHPP